MLTEISLFAIILFCLLVLYFVSSQTPAKNNQAGFTNPTNHVGKCSSLDPVSEPEYNMKQIAIQSILLEEHLTQKEKRCRDCIAKHFLHIMGLHSEAIWLAGDHVDKFPLLKETSGVHAALFDEWLNGQSDDKVYVNVATKLREIRKKIVAIYCFGDVSGTSSCSKV